MRDKGAGVFIHQHLPVEVLPDKSTTAKTVSESSSAIKMPILLLEVCHRTMTWARLNELMYLKCLDQCTAHGKSSISVTYYYI